MPRIRPSISRLTFVAGLSLVLAIACAAPASASERKSWSGQITIRDAALPEVLNTDGVPFAGAWNSMNGEYLLTATYDVREGGSDKDHSGIEIDLTGGGKTKLQYSLDGNFCESVAYPDSGSCDGVGPDSQAFGIMAHAAASGRLGFVTNKTRAAQTSPLTLFLPRDDRPFGAGPDLPKHHNYSAPFVIGLASLQGDANKGLSLPDVSWERLVSGAGCPGQSLQLLEDQAYRNGVVTDKRAGLYNDDNTGCVSREESRGTPQSLSLWPALTWFSDVITDGSTPFHGLSGSDGCTLKPANHVLFQDYSVCGYYDYLTPHDKIKGEQYATYDVNTPFKPYVTTAQSQVGDDLWVDSPAYAPYNGFGYVIWHRTLGVQYDLKRK
jgi:hypothetical protein